MSWRQWCEDCFNLRIRGVVWKELTAPGAAMAKVAVRTATRIENFMENEVVESVLMVLGRRDLD
jgi:hypothetical protein